MDPISAAIVEAFGAAPAAMTRLQGGDLSEVWRVRLASGREVVAKTGPLVLREGRMLEAIAATGAPAPAVLATTRDMLLLDYLPETRPGAESWAALGAGLARLYGAQGRQYGWSVDFGFGPVAIDNSRSDDWQSFWAQNRLLAGDGDDLAGLRPRLEALCARLPDLIPSAPPKALLHGDLWTGNVLFTDASAYLIDPACYHGDPEVDLAMLELFGTPHPAFYEAHGTPAGDWPTRRAVYQLWPALVHLRLFGAGYRGMVEDRLAFLGA